MGSLVVSIPKMSKNFFFKYQDSFAVLLRVDDGFTSVACVRSRSRVKDRY